MIYLDTSALVKLVVTEAETSALRAWLASQTTHLRATSELSCVELVRAVAHHGPAYKQQARVLLHEGLDLVDLSRTTLHTAAELPPDVLRSLDAVHLGAAVRLGDALSTFLAYDKRLLAAAEGLGLPTACPAP